MSLTTTQHFVDALTIAFMLAAILYTVSSFVLFVSDKLTLSQCQLEPIAAAAAAQPPLTETPTLIQQEEVTQRTIAPQTSPTIAPLSPLPPNPTIRDLKQLAKGRIPNYGKMTKPQLVTALARRRMSIAANRCAAAVAAA